MQYYTLFEREADGRWFEQFGAYNRKEVQEEKMCFRDNGIKAKDLVIVAHAGTYESLMNALSKLNAQ